jgi:hypothetical protein
MEHRLGRTLRVFLISLAAAGFYRLAVVPLVEPRVRDMAAGMEMTPEEAAAIRARADQRLAALGDIFPAGAWERDDPIVLESRQMRLLFKEYQSLPDGRVNLVPCTLVVLPDRARTPEGPPGRTIVMRAPTGAVLEFDEPLDLRQGRLARLIGGSLRGQVTIRGTPSAPGAEDDVEIVTRDVELDEFEVHTGEAVQFRYGRSNGSGRGLLARLTPRATPQGPDALGQGPNIGGVDSIRLDRDVRIRLEGMNGGFLPGTPAKDATASSDVPPPPVLVSCRGSLTLNVPANVITLADHVDVVRPTPDGGSDQITCDLLAILMAHEGEQKEGEKPKGPLKPTEIQAKGAPVVVRSTGAALEARATRLGYEVATRRILLDGTEPVSLVAKGSEMEARKIDYTPGPPGDPGSLMAVGPGWLRVQSPGQPVSHARWQQWLRMRPDGEGHVVSISGDADVVVETRGRLSAGEMHLWLDVVRPPEGAPRRDPAAGPDLSGVKPSRMLARGMVEVGADQVLARTDRLELWFRELPPPPKPAAPAGPRPAQVAAAPPAAPPAVPVQQPPAPEQPPGARITATAALVRGLVTLTPKGAELSEMSMEGQVELVEQPAGTATEGPPVEIRGDQMQVARPTAFDARAVVSGRPATIIGRGLDLEGPLVEFDRGRNRVTVDGAGRLSLPMPAEGPGLDGLALTGAAPKPPVAGANAGKLDVTWKGRLDFDGQTARFVEDVVANGGTTIVRSGSLDVVFDEPFEFAGDRKAKPGRQPGRQPEVARVACGGGVKIESESIDEAGDRSVERLFVRDLVVERVSGEVSGTGPGRLTSTRKGQSPQFAAPASPGSVPVTPVATPRPKADGLSYLGVDFQRGLRGNIHRRSMEFHQRVEAIWGPVARWEDSLDPHAARGLPEGAVTIACDVLGVGQSPPTPGQPRGTLELNAGGNVLVEGESFTARSARLNWSEAKDLLVFAGDGRSDAQLYRQLKVGGQPSTAAAGRILYWRGQNRVEVEDARYLDLDQLGGGQSPNLPGAGPGKRPVPPTPFTPQPVPGT